MEVEIVSATGERWPDVESLFGPRGAVGGCWCMWWYQRGKEFDTNAGEPNRLALRERVLSGRPPGLLAYADGNAVAWCALGPRDEYKRIGHSRNFKPAEADPGAWAITCFFVARVARKQGLASQLLARAIDFARENGATNIEGYPVDTRDRAMNPYDFTGTQSMFERAGFVEAERRGKNRPIMRLSLDS
jgi:GNAT superfamily N-acetyltransferase